MINTKVNSGQIVQKLKLDAPNRSTEAIQRGVKCNGAVNQYLGAVGVGTRVGHGQAALAGVLQLEVLICKIIQIQRLQLNHDVMLYECPLLFHCSVPGNLEP